MEPTKMVNILYLYYLKYAIDYSIHASVAGYSDLISENIMTQPNNTGSSEKEDQLKWFQEQFLRLENMLEDLKEKTDRLEERLKDREYNSLQYNNINKREKSLRYSNRRRVEDGFNDFNEAADHPFFR